MGSCISKCNPQKNSQEDDDHHHHECVKDKLVISQAPISPKIPLPSFPSSTIQPRKLMSSSSSSSSCSVSVSSFSSTATNVTLSSSLSSSSSSSSFKDRSFSNDFLLSCAHEHDHILDIKKSKVINSITHQNTSTMSTSGKKYSRSPSPSSSSTLSKPPSPRREHNSMTTPKKRPRANSPTMVRQKSFRKEPDQQLIKGGNIGNNISNITSIYHHFPSPRTTLKSPSPSRRFPSNSNGDMKENSFRKSIASKGHNGSVISRSSSLRRENNLTPKNEGKMRNVLPVSPKIDEMEIGEVKSSDHQDLDSFLMEDINNPLIALDCFIFL